MENFFIIINNNDNVSAVNGANESWLDTTTNPIAKRRVTLDKIVEETSEDTLIEFDEDNNGVLDLDELKKFLGAKACGGEIEGVSVDKLLDEANGGIVIKKDNEENVSELEGSEALYLKKSHRAIELIKEDDNVPFDLMQKRDINEVALENVLVRINNLKAREDKLTDTEKEELKKLEEEKERLEKEREETEQEILQYCLDDTKKAVREMQDARSTLEYEKKVQSIEDLIVNDKNVPFELIEKRAKNILEVDSVVKQINALKSKGLELTDDEKLKLQKLEEEKARLEKERKEIEQEILKYCSDDTKKEIENIQGTKGTIFGGGTSGLTPSGNTENNTSTDTASTSETTTPEASTTQESNTSSESHGGGGGGSYYSDSTTTTTDNTNNTKSYDNMTKEELQKELESANGDLSQKQGDLKSILDGSDSTLSGLKEEEKQKYEEYQKVLNDVAPELREKYNNAKEQKEAKENEVANKKLDVTTGEANVATSQANYDNSVATTKMYEETVSSLESTIAKEDDAEKKSSLSSKLASAKASLEKSREQEKLTKEALDTAKEQLEQFKQELTQLEEEQAQLETQLETVEKEVSETENEDLKTALNDYKQVQSNYTDTKDKMAQKAESEVKEAQGKVSTIQTALNTKENNEVKRDLIPSDGSKVVEVAKNYLGERNYKKYFTHGIETAWCAAFVNTILKEAEEKNGVKIPEWYKNIGKESSGTWWCPAVLDAAKKAGATKKASEGKAGDLIIFGWGGTGGANHIGIVKEVKDGKIYTVEGNSGGTVREKEYDLNSKCITAVLSTDVD